MQQDTRILADRIEQHRLAELRHHLAQDMERLVFQPLQMWRQSRGFREDLKRHSLFACRASVSLAGTAGSGEAVDTLSSPQCCAMASTLIDFESDAALSEPLSAIVAVVANGVFFANQPPPTRAA